MISTDIRSVLIRDAREEAILDGSPAVEAEHLLLALARQESGTTGRLLAEHGLTRDAIRAALDREWQGGLSAAGLAVLVSELPKATPDPGRNVGFAESAKQTLKAAADYARSQGAKRIDGGHVLVGILDARLGRVARTLALAGIDREAFAAAARAASRD
ncbi:Clp protease N-terminal domain-containing protein [Kribbella sp. NPDC006257]|uniref:Clp protease N-terminal domain-containing protein n=1 Tax=Kribbella sp. NPDC006257 TaxID=3156738 RepID=UPI0033B0A108